MALLGLLLIPIIIMVVGFFLGKGKITGKEFAAQFGVVVVLVTAGYFIGRWSRTADVELWNGKIARKDAGTHHCCHSYSCNCRQVCSGSGQDRSCHEECDTCYRHPWTGDNYWSATTTNSEVIFNDRCNPPSSSAPRRWLDIRVGEPTTVEHTYTNYIKAAPRTILRRHGLAKKYAKITPAYPEVHDYYRSNRFLFVGVSGYDSDDVRRWNQRLAEINGELGARKQVNMIVIVVATDDRGYLHGLEEAWLGGKKNDVVVIIGAPEYTKISWAAVMSWTKVEEMKIAIRDRIESSEAFDGDKILGIISEEVEARFIRRPMADFEYLSKSITPSFGVMIFLFILGVGVCGWLQWYFYQNDPFGYGESRYSGYGAFRRRRPF